VHVVLLDGLLGQVAGLGDTGLGVVGLDGDVVGRAADLEPVLVRAGHLDLADHPVVRFAEPGQVPGQRVDPPDSDRLAAGRARGAAARGGALDARTAGLQEAAASDDGRTDAGCAEQAAPGNTAGVWLALRTGLSILVGHDLNISFRRDAEIVAEGCGKSL